jgi:hypothetical protein
VDPADLLEPGGVSIGDEGSQPSIREVPGGIRAAEDLFSQLTDGATPAPRPNYPGDCYGLPGGGWAGYRPVSKSGSPVIDIDIPGVSIKKIHFL